MSLSSVMLTGVSGLAATSTALSGISNNIANVNTTAYKRIETNLSATVTSSAGTTYTGSGVSASTSMSVSQAGALQTTTSALDMAIDGNGFFVVSDTSAAGSASLYTRDGSFSVDADGYLVNASGYYLQGWTADSSGNVTTGGLTSQLSAIRIPTSGDDPEATTEVSLSANLNSTTEAYTGEYDISTGLSMTSYDAEAGTGVEPDFEITIPVSDSQGGEHSLTLSFLKSETANEWTVELWSDDVSGGYGADGNIIKTGTISFNEDGSINTDSLNAFLGSEGSTISIGASSDESGGLHWNSDLGIEGQAITLDISDGLTQMASASTVNSVEANGTVFSDVTDVQIGEDGTVTAVYEDGSTRTIAQVALATFVNADGLKAVSGNAYKATSASGSYTLKTPGSEGAGSLTASALEASTVDLATEFTDLITVQRAYSASSKIITTADEMLQELISLKR
ncbi:flagellar hook protein FlgE [Asticcacaulis sp. BYS171W]|uniref:Flagellar hook protein FlgE n=1 Tax=Asticcacaulis aquaticus TaxID=2984212 RepID=A0ABT5HYL9_9CAUL|nr:flagellar hook protein FlgE [Asticcacaulis aquaticus]MDC7685128.1 flagellar hook protein FlgE [Asticcacaulis aquaticus]